MPSIYSQNAENEGLMDQPNRVLHKSRIGIKRNASALLNEPRNEKRKLGSNKKRAVLGDVTNQIHAKKVKLQAHSNASQDVQVRKSSKRTIASLFQPKFAAASALLSRKSYKPTSILEKDEHDIDSQDKHDASACWQYAQDITQYQLSAEKNFLPDSAYMARQSDINSKMRSILIDWLVDVHCKYDLTPHALHIAIQLIDRHLAQNLTVPRQRLQLVGVTSMFVASKYEEIYPPEAEDFVRITDNAYTLEEIFGMEEDILSSVSYRVTFPTAYHFLQRFIKAAKAKDDRVKHFAHYIIDRSLQEYKMIRYRPSMIAASAVYIAKSQVRDLPLWTQTLRFHTSYMEAELLRCVTELKEMLRTAQNGIGKTSKLSAVRRKFEKERFMGVSKYPLTF